MDYFADFLLQLEFVKDKATKEPFDPKARLSFHIQEKGLQPEYAVSLYGCTGTVDGIRGDHVVLAPPYIVTKEEIDTLVDVLARVLTDVLAELEK
jgi:adenosylmethionine-8-amino-7-oxononanoate aminotransferase